MSEIKEIINSGYFYIKPAANHILTIGKGIIKDSYTAILELVKNSYDADAENVNIKLLFNETSIVISIEDDGHGMNYETVTNKWMVPSTSMKLKQQKSLYKKRPLQGRKGIGRYAASILGNDLLLKTTEKESLETTELLINWDDFLNDTIFLEDVDILIENYKSNDTKPGTYLEITGNKLWPDKEIDELISSLKRMLSPFDEIDNDFNIFLEITKPQSIKYNFFSEKIRPLPILEYYHYRISGNTIFQNNKVIAFLTLENKHLKNILPIELKKEFSLIEGKYCGDLDIDIRAYDLDENLQVHDTRVNTDEAKKQLKELPGIAVIREGFRVRPYGDKKVDWLGLNERRYNNPTLRLSSNQVAGYVSVLQEDESHLEEKATREGFKEDEYYEALKEIILACLIELEQLRYRFRRQHNKGGKKQKSIGERINDISSFNTLNTKINSVLSSANIPDNISNQLQLIIKQEEKDKEEQLEEIKKTIAQYQGQVTLGKIMTIVFHEGRKPLNALKQHPKFITTWCNDYLSLMKENDCPDIEEAKVLQDRIIDRLNDNKQQAEIFIKIFKKLEPLANNKRSLRKEFEILKPIDDAFKLFENEIEEKNIKYAITGDLETKFKGWDIDILIAFANLIENSIYWISNKSENIIEVTITDLDDMISIDYLDSGTGIDEESIQNQDIFDPGFSTKEEGTGLGLSIAGEALERNRGNIRAISSTNGANFIIELKKV